MQAKTLLKNSGIKFPAGLKDFQVLGVSCNSKTVGDGFVFVAIKGNRADGNKFIAEAVSNGAKAVITENPKPEIRNPKNTYFLKVKDTRKVLARLAAEFYGRPSEKVRVAGVTGTNGKTTITYLIEAIVKEAGLEPAVIGTINYRFKDKIIPSKNTTPGPIELQSMLARMRDAGIDHCVMEVSSHALDQDRAQDIDFGSGIFTNLTQDHLDYHKTLEEYFKAKSKLFKNLSAGSFAVINIDDKYAKKLAKSTKAKVITYGIDNDAAVKALDIRFDVSSTEFTISSPKNDLKIKTSLIGKHNVYNILAAFAWAQKEGIDAQAIKKAIEKFTLVPGRLERVDCDSDFAVFVDYAHTEDALKNIIQSLRQISSRRIIVVFGCGGERDRTKRPKMGRVVSELSDYAIITSDNPRSEDPLQIIEEIKKGIKKDNFCVIPERMEAIRRSLSLAGCGDIVLVAGKGHEDYQILKDKILHFDDREAVKECLRSMN
jgi:UDP-N-acetylmuramoyl-L-alanyl-D-glutamate--2,6-diaminopimelate ligase